MTEALVASERRLPTRTHTGEWSLRWPPVVRAALVGYRERIEAQLPGDRVLDLADEPARRLVLEAAVSSVASGRSDALGPEDVRFDAVISVAALVVFPDLPLALQGILRLLDPAGALLLVEPVVRPGWAGIARGSVGSLHPAVRHQHVNRDVPHTVRESGLFITDIERFTMPTPLWPLRWFVHAQAIPRAGMVGA